MKLSERRSIGFGFAASLFWGPQTVTDAADTPELIERIHEGSLLGRARAQVARVVLRSMEDDQAGFDEAIEQLERLHVDIGDPSLRYLNAQPRLEALWRLGRVEDAVRWGATAKESYDRLGETGANSTLAAITASYAVVQGSLDLAERLLADAQAMAAADDFAAHVPIGWAAALLASNHGDDEKALREIDRALEWIRPTDYLWLHAETERVHAMVLSAAGHVAEAKAAFGAALEMFELKGDVASANRLREHVARWQDARPR
jgi:tetratricopeptide (TPR) repeat protein